MRAFPGTIEVIGKVCGNSALDEHKNGNQQPVHWMIIFEVKTVEAVVTNNQ